MAATSYKIRGIEPPDLGSEREVRLMFWTWVRDIGLKVKDQELAQGLDKDGQPLRSISPQTRKHRRSAMTPSGKGDPAAPPLMPAYQLSRTRSLLAGRALTTHAEFYWLFDAFTGDSWGVILEIHARKGRNVIGISAKGLARVKAEAWQRWARWKAGKLGAIPALASASPGIPQVGSRDMTHATMGIGSDSPDVFKAGNFSGGKTWPEWQRYFRQTNPAPVAIPGRPAGPYNRLLAHVWGQSLAGPGGPKIAAPKPPKPKPPGRPPAKPSPPAAPAPVPSARPPAPPSPSAAIDQLLAYGRAQGFRLEALAPGEAQGNFGVDASVPMFYRAAARTIYANPDSDMFRSSDPAGMAARQAASRWWVSGTLEGLVDHEIGHARHHAALGDDYRDKRLREAWDAEAAAKIRARVSGYAAQSRVEFVAEVYSGLKSGVKYDPGIMQTYKDLGGAMP